MKNANATAQKPSADKKKATNLKVEKAVPTAEERIERAKNFEILSERYEILKDNKAKLARFEIAKDGESSSLELKTPKGDRFHTANNIVNGAVLEALRTSIDNLLEDAKKAVLDFNV